MFDPTPKDAAGIIRDHENRERYQELRERPKGSHAWVFQGLFYELVDEEIGSLRIVGDDLSLVYLGQEGPLEGACLISWLLNGGYVDPDNDLPIDLEDGDELRPEITTASTDAKTASAVYKIE